MQQRFLTLDALIVLLRCSGHQQSKLYCCSALVGVSGTHISRLQSVPNAAARLGYAGRRSDHMTPYLLEIHWLMNTERIQFRLCVLVYRCLNGTAPANLSYSIHLAADADVHQRLR